MKDTQKPSKYSFGLIARTVVTLIVFILFYIHWDEPKITFFGLVLGIIIAWVIVKSNIIASTSPTVSRNSTSVIPLVIFIGLWLFFAWASVYLDWVNGSRALPFHAAGLVLLGLVYLMRPGGRLDPDRH